MIAYLKGKLVYKQPDRVIIDVAGVGYQVRISTQTFSGLPGLETAIKLFTYHHFTEAEQSLFGFTATEEKSLFELLITVKGIGPRLGLTILSGMKPDEITDTILRQDVPGLTRIPGIGKKTAERMVLELKDKLTGVAGSENGSGAHPGGLIQTETISALEALGYRKADAGDAVRKAVKSAQQPFEDVSALLKEALKELSR